MVTGPRAQGDHLMPALGKPEEQRRQDRAEHQPSGDPDADRDAAAGVPTPMRDMRPALRGALDELNRLAARRG